MADRRKALSDLKERYLPADPSNTTVRDLELEFEYQGRGAPRKPPFISVKKWAETQPGNSWKRIIVREGSRGLPEVDIIAAKVAGQERPQGRP